MKISRIPGSLALGAFFSICLFHASAPVSAASLSLSEKGVEIDNGADAQFVLEYPALVVGADKKKVKIENKELSEKSVKLSYAGGGAVTLTLGDGQITMQTADLPAESKFLSGTLQIGAPFAGGGNWKLGSTEGAFPVEAAKPPLLGQGTATSFSLTSPGGAATILEVPAGTFQQLQDARSWGSAGFFWQYWAPVDVTDTVTISISDKAGAAPSVAPKKRAASAPAAAAGADPEVATKPRTAAVPAPLPTVAVGETKVLKWKDGKRSPFMLEFDDSCAGQLINVIPELVKRKMVGTFYAVGSGAVYKNKQKDWEAAAKLPGIEIANHTAHHNGVQNVEELKSELTECNEVIKGLYPDRPWPRLISFGTPGGVPWKVEKADFEAALAERHLINRPSFSGPPLSYKGIDNTLDVVDNAIAKNEMGHVDFHGVGADWHVSSIKLFHALLDHLELNKDAVWVTDPVSYHQYLTERKTAKVATLESKPALITLSLTSEADPQFYNLPLTLVTGVPADWQNCIVTQGKATTTVPVTGGLAKYDALPGDAKITLAKK